jgi:hypothetical protein
MLGNGYFLSALAAIAEVPERIERIFLDGSLDNEQLATAGTLFINGLPKTVIVDQNLPVNSRDELAFAQGEEMDLWVPMLEKLWAKACGGYDKTIGGKVKEALRVLTGAPTDEYNHDEIEMDRLWKKIKYADNSKYIVCASLEDQCEEFSTGTSCSVIGVSEITVKNKKTKLIKLRNVFGTCEWKGDWSPTSALWTKDALSQIGRNTGNDGSFFMSFSDFYQVFEETTICRIHDEFVITSSEFEVTKEDTC